VSSLRLLDLFAGAGGLTQGFLSTGAFRSVGAVEQDADAASTYALNHGANVHVGDIAEWAHGSMPFAEVVVGGPPCQGFSPLGRRDPYDSRNALWRRYVEVVARVRPALFVLENVPQFLEGSEFAGLVGETRRGGRLDRWVVEAHVLDASVYGVAQSRRRAFVVGRPRGTRPMGAPPTMGAAMTLRQAIGDVPSRVTQVDLARRRTTVLGRETAGAFTSQDLHVTTSSSPISLERYRAVPAGGSRLDLPDRLKLPAWRKDYRGAADVLGRLRWDRPSVTLRTEFFRPEKGRFLHPDEDRALTHFEAARLQGFPDDYRWCGSKAAIARQIGNAVPVPLAAAVALKVSAVLA
jgi:DNA (cytosine-5)-methyltransferase 1